MYFFSPPLANAEEEKDKEKDGDTQRQIVGLADEFLYIIILILSKSPKLISTKFIEQPWCQLNLYSNYITDQIGDIRF